MSERGREKRAKERRKVGRRVRGERREEGRRVRDRDNIYGYAIIH